MFSNFLLKLINPIIDDSIKAVFEKEYSENPLVLYTAMQKLGVKAIVEASLRANSGNILSQPYGSSIIKSPWDDLLFSPKQLFMMPTVSLNDINTDVVIGKSSKKPLILSSPILFTGMSFGGSLSKELKISLAKASNVLNTLTNTGESSLSKDVRKNAKYVIGQYNRAELLVNPDLLSQLDAIEVQLGQGAWGGGCESYTYSKDIDEELRDVWNVKEFEDVFFHSRMPNVNNEEDLIKLINDLKNTYGVPIGIKIAGSDYIELELEVIKETNADYIVIDGAEGGTAGSQPTLIDNVGLPTLYSLYRTVSYLEKNNLRDRFDVIIAGGLSTPGHFLKALALGATAVYIGSISIFAAISKQASKSLPFNPPTQMALYTGKDKEKLNIEKSVQNLVNFINSCNEEMKLVLQTLSKNSVTELSKDDLVSLDKELANGLNVRYALNNR